MRRRSRAGGKSPNAQGPKAAARKSRSAPTVVRSRKSSAAREATKVAQLTRELKEALEQKAATSEVLRSSAVRRPIYKWYSVRCSRLQCTSADQQLRASGDPTRKCSS
jgi:hypothetical protein